MKPYLEADSNGRILMRQPQSPSQAERTKVLATSRHRYVWSIGIYSGVSPFKLSPDSHIVNPVLTHSDVSDVTATFVADPFMLRIKHLWFMFFEVMNSRSNKGEIGLAASTDGLKWKYRQIVLDEPFHLSYPYVFEWQGEFYMIPETATTGTVRLYKASSFPTKWSFLQTLIDGQFADASIFYFEDRWWLFACSTPFQHDSLRLYFSCDLVGPWIEHPRSPIVEGNCSIARPGGRVIAFNGRIIRFAQDCYPFYGQQLRAFEISQLTPTGYAEQEAAECPILKGGGSGWNRYGMHTVDPHLIGKRRWIACVDGMTRETLP